MEASALETERDWPHRTAGVGRAECRERWRRTGPCLWPSPSPASRPYCPFHIRSQIQIDPYLPALPRHPPRCPPPPRPPRKCLPRPNSPMSVAECVHGVDERAQRAGRGDSPMGNGRGPSTVLLSRTAAPHDPLLCLSHCDPLPRLQAQAVPHLWALDAPSGVALGGVYPITPPAFPVLARAPGPGCPRPDSPPPDPVTVRHRPCAASPGRVCPASSFSALQPPACARPGPDAPSRCLLCLCFLLSRPASRRRRRHSAYPGWRLRQARRPAWTESPRQ